MNHKIAKRALIAGATLTAVLGIGGVAHAATPTAATATSHHLSVGQTSAASGSHHGTSAQGQTAGESASENSGETAAHETDGPGGHADPAGQNADHQFNGVE